MSIWKDLTKPTSFAGQHDSVIELAVPAQRSTETSGASAPTLKSILGPGVFVEGTIESSEDIRICGRVNGDIRVQGTLIVGSEARIVGSVDARDVMLAGELEGNIVASHQVTLLKTGKLLGDLRAKLFTAALGARLRGRVDFGSDEVKSQPVEEPDSDTRGSAPLRKEFGDEQVSTDLRGASVN